MKNILRHYIETLYNEYDCISFHAPRNTGKTISFAKSIINDLVEEKKDAYVITNSKKYLKEFLLIFSRLIKEKHMKYYSESYFGFYNDSRIFFRSISDFKTGKDIKSDIYYFDAVYSTIDISILYYLNLDAKFIFNDCSFNENLLGTLNKIKKNNTNVIINDINDINILLRWKKIQKIRNQLFSF